MVQFLKGRKSKWKVQLRNASGKVVSASFAKKEDAIAFEQKEVRKKQLQKRGLALPKEEILFIDRAKAYLKKVYKKNVSADQDEGRFRNYWLKDFGNRPMAEITTSEIKEKLDYIEFELGHAPADRNRHRALMNAFFQDAYMDGKIEHNPVTRIPLVKEKKKRVKFGKVNSTEDWNKYLAEVYAQGSHFGILAELMAWTGARIMAAAAFQYLDFDFKTNTARIGRLIDRHNRNAVVDRAKGEGEEGENVVPLFPTLKHAINARRSNTEYTRPTDFIAAKPDGSFITYEEYRTVHENALRRSKVERFTPHAIRKFFATNAKRGGFTRAEIRELLGHSSEAVTALYDLKDIEHLTEKGKRLGFGSVTQVSPKKSKSTGSRGGDRG